MENVEVAAAKEQEAQRAPSERDLYLMEKIRETLKCPNCMELMHPPIYLCTRGHGYCEACSNVLRVCIFCCAGITWTRCIAMEKLHHKAILLCKYKDRGCLHKCLGSEIEAHEKACSFNPLTTEDELEKTPSKEISS